MDGLDWTRQYDFSGGAYPSQERVPPNAVENLLNGLYDDDGAIYERGGGVYQSAAAAGSILGVYDAELVSGRRTVMTLADRLVTLDTDDSTVVDVVAAGAGITYSARRVGIVDGVMAVPWLNGTTPSVTTYGGSRKPYGSSYTTGTVTLTNGSKTVTGAGTGWLANVDAGSVFYRGTYGYVAQVNSDTSLTLAHPWPGITGAGLGAYAVTPTAGANAGVALLPSGTIPFTAGVAGRLVIGVDRRVAFSATGNLLGFTGTDYHEIPDGGRLLGLQPFGTSLLIFATTGVYRIDNLAYDLTDALGNVQQVLSTEGNDVVLWDDKGVAGFDGGVLIPAIDGPYIQSKAGLQRFAAAAGIQKLWRAYAASGYTLGNATTYRNHYFLPILFGTEHADLFVLRLDTGAWSRWDGHSAGVSFARRAATESGPPRLLAAKSTRVLDLNGTFAPAAANKLEADGSTPQFQVTFGTVHRKTSKDLLVKFRVRYELDDAIDDNPTVTAEVAVGRTDSTYTTLTGTGGENRGQDPKTWRVGKRGSEFRVRLTSSGPSSGLVIRSVEYGFRPSGRQ